MALRWCELAHFEDLHQVVQVLDVAAVMPSKYIRLFAVDQVGHCIDPARVFNSCQPSVLCILLNLKYIAAFERVTVIAYAALHRLELAACLALLGW